MISGLRAARRADASVPVLVAGDPEYAQAERRAKEGIALPTDLYAALRTAAQRTAAEWILGDS